MSSRGPDQRCLPWTSALCANSRTQHEGLCSDEDLRWWEVKEAMWINMVVVMAIRQDVVGDSSHLQDDDSRVDSTQQK